MVLGITLLFWRKQKIHKSERMGLATFITKTLVAFLKFVIFFIFPIHSQIISNYLTNNVSYFRVIILMFGDFEPGITFFSGVHIFSMGYI